jgi:hypothetical protein
MKKPATQPPGYDDERQPRYFRKEAWLNSPLSIARFWGSCTYNGAHYEVDPLSEDLCREDEARARRLAYTEADKATVRSKYLKK